MNVLSNVAIFLIDTLFTLYIVLIVIRLLLGLARADFYNPISQFVVAATNPLLKPLRRILPAFGRVDTAAILLMLLLTLLQYYLLLALQGQSVNPLLLLPVAIVKLLELVIYVYIFALILQAVISWVNPGAHQLQSPMNSLLNSLTKPILRPLSQIVPRIGMIDLTPLAAILLLNIALIVIRSLT